MKNKSIKKLENNAGVYAISCNDCNRKYIGESDNIPQRMYNHKYQIRRNNLDNPIFKHISDYNHSVTVENNKTIVKLQDIKQRKFTESFFISTVPNMNCNSKSTNNIDKTTCNILLHFIPNFKKLLNNVLSLDTG